MKREFFSRENGPKKFLKKVGAVAMAGVLAAGLAEKTAPYLEDSLASKTEKLKTGKGDNGFDKNSLSPHDKPTEKKLQPVVDEPKTIKKTENPPQADTTPTSANETAEYVSPALQVALEKVKQIFPNLTATTLNHPEIVANYGAGNVALFSEKSEKNGVSSEEIFFDITCEADGTYTVSPITTLGVNEDSEINVPASGLKKVLEDKLSIRTMADEYSKKGNGSREELEKLIKDLNHGRVRGGQIGRNDGINFS